MQKKYYSPDEATGGGAATATAPNFELLTEDLFDPNYNATAVKEEKKIEEKLEKETKEEVPVDLNLQEEIKETTKEEAKSEEKSSETKQETSTETASNDFELKLDDTNINGNEESAVWIETAKELFGLEPENNSYEAFVEAARVAVEQAELRGKETTLEKEIAELPVEAQIDFMLLREGYTREQINEPTKEIDTLLSYSNIDLVKKDLELQGMSESLIEKEIELLTEKGLIDHEAEKLKLVLHNARESVLTERQQLAEQVATNYHARLQAEKQAQAELMSNAFNTVKDFMGQPINENARKQLANRYAEGAYDSIFNDPVKKAEFIMYYHFGEQAAKNIRNKALEEGREKVTKHLSNVPPVPQHNNTKVAVKQNAKTTSGFESLSSLFGE
jgi:hypothetical protein